uniref:Protein containing CCSAP domain n=1 Tax=Rhipicephalus zambeziensis TaxID=60191 RepID=A0A224Y9Z6_9ACAR
MVLRKSEYRKNFKWFSPDKRNAMWLENALYRAERRQREYGHEPLGDEQDSGYELGDSESEECGLPPTKLRQRRLQLIAESSSAAKKRAEGDVVLGGQRKSTPPRRRPVEEVDAGLFLASPDRHAATQTARPAKKDVAVQTVVADLVKMPRIAQDHKRRNRSRYRGSPRKELEPCQRCFALWGAPFENYGWADEVDTIGTKQTFNVAASTNEIYPSALAAARTREQSPTPPPPMHRKTYRPGRPHSAPPKDWRIWISEYREQYR